MRTVIFAIMCVLLTSCCTYEIKNNNAQSCTDKPAKEKSLDLISHIKSRTVLVTIQCKDISTVDYTVVKDYYTFGWGTGTIMKSLSNGSFIQTAAHVVSIRQEELKDKTVVCDKFHVITATGKEITKVKVIFKSSKSDVAILVVPEDLGVRSTIANVLSLGQKIHTMGFPFLKGFNNPIITYSVGFISALNIKAEQTHMGIDNLVRFSIFGYTGSSGSAVWDDDGNIVGIISLQAGFKTLLEMIPQQDSLYGVGYSTLKELYQSLGLSSMSK